MKTIAVLGAKGRLSSQIVKAFHNDGWQVIAITRNGDARKLAPEIEQRSANALDRRKLITATRGADVIFNGLNPAYTRWHKDAMRMANNVMAAAKAHGASHLFPGNVYNFGRNIPIICDEQSSFEATTRKGTIRIEMEALFKNSAKQFGVQTIILRAGDFYGGSKRGSWFDLALVSKLDKSVFTYPGPMDIPHSWAYLPDMAANFVKLAHNLDGLGRFETFGFPSHTMTGLEIKNHLQAITGRKLKNAGLPWKLIKIGGLVIPIWREISEMSYLWEKEHRISGERLETFLGEVQNTNPRIAIENSLASLGINTS